jgi:hypothetical protein
MGAIQSAILEPRVLAAEIAILRHEKFCYHDGLGAFEDDLKFNLKSLVTDVPEDVLDAFSKGTLDPAQTELVKASILDQVNEFQVSKDLKSRFYDFRLMYMLTCVFGNLWYVNKDTLEATEYAKKYFRITENLSTGQYGVVLKGQRGGSDLNFVIRTQLVSQYAELTIHEMFVALMTLNNLRAYCPNFSCIYGGFICGDPNVIEGRICAGDTPVPYTVYEAIDGVDSAKQMIELAPTRSILKAGQVVQVPLDVDIMNPNVTAPLYEFTFSILLQLNFALQIAYAKAFRFTHRDLHSGNVICRPLGGPKLLRYDSLYLRIDDPDKRVKRIDQPELFSKEERTIYYVNSNYVATVIDYDWSQVYYVVDPDNDVDPSIARFGKAEYDDIEAELVNTVNINRVRDFIKFLGFTTYNAFNIKANTGYHEVLCDLYLAMAKPYLTVRRDLQGIYPNIIPTSPPILSLADKIKEVRLDAVSLFRITRIQGALIQDGIITMESFLTYFRQIVPPHYQQRVLYQTTLTPDPNRDVTSMIDGTPEMDAADAAAEAVFFASVLKCRGECLGQSEAYDRVLTTPTLGEYTQLDRRNPTNLPHHVNRLQTSYHTFNKTSVSVRARVADHILGPGPAGNAAIQKRPVAYKDFLTERIQNLLAQEKVIKDNHIEKVLADIQTKLGFVQWGLARNVPPIPENFHTQYPGGPQQGIEAYKAFLVNVFKIVSTCRDAITLNNGLVGIRPELAGQLRLPLMQATADITTYWKTSIIPWRNKLSTLYTAKFFKALDRDVNDRIQYSIITKIPSSVSFVPIL